jgi:hypothetical protein
MPRVRIYLDAHARVYFTPLGFSSLFFARALTTPRKPLFRWRCTHGFVLFMCVCAGELLVIY